LARLIREQYLIRTGNELTPDALIPLCLDRSLEMIIAILAVLKAGAAYVPIDPSYPKERIDFLLQDTNAQIILSQNHLSTKQILPQNKVICVDLDQQCYEIFSTENLIPYSGPNNLAYVIYTSGTTGKPKGVMIEHGGICNYLHS